MRGVGNTIKLKKDITILFINLKNRLLRKIETSEGIKQKTLTLAQAFKPHEAEETRKQQEQHKRARSGHHKKKPLCI